ncbi:hypothetical protein BGZ74_006759 [Mortierella antarctica]|nr:hypothetical protein BGZ74_006759 [Mortierella antarctica]
MSSNHVRIRTVSSGSTDPYGNYLRASTIVTIKVPKSSPHKYTNEQETFLAYILANHDIWAVLGDTNIKSKRSDSKCDLREVIAEKVNRAFSTRTQPLKLTQIQIRTKVTNMHRTWNRAYAIATNPNNCRLSSSDLQYKVTECCHYYYILEEVWTPSWIIQRLHLKQESIPNGPSAGTGDFTDDETESHGIETAESSSVSTIPKAKESLRNLWPDKEEYQFTPDDSEKVERDLKRRRLELEREQQELDRQNHEMHAAQVEKHTNNMLAEIEKVVLSTARVKTERDLGLAEKAVELAQLQLAHRKVDLELIKQQIQLEQLQESSQNTPNQQRSVGEGEGSTEEVQQRIIDLQIQRVHAGMDYESIKAQCDMELQSKSMVIEKERIKLEAKKLDLGEVVLQLRRATEESSSRAQNNFVQSKIFQ